MKKLTLQTHGGHQQRRENQQDDVLDLTTCSLPEICLADVEHILETVDIRIAGILIQACKNFVQVLGDVLTRALFEQVCDV